MGNMRIDNHILSALMARPERVQTEGTQTPKGPTRSEAYIPQLGSPIYVHAAVDIGAGDSEACPSSMTRKSSLASELQNHRPFEGSWLWTWGLDLSATGWMMEACCDHLGSRRSGALA